MVIICSRKKQQVDGAVHALRSEGLNAEGVACNVTNEADRAALLAFVKERTDEVHALVLNQGATAGGGPLLDSTTSMWKKIMVSALVQ